MLDGSRTQYVTRTHNVVGMLLRDISIVVVAGRIQVGAEKELVTSETETGDKSVVMLG